MTGPESATPGKRMSRSNGFWIGLALLGAGSGLVFLANEGIQRRKFAVLTDDLNAALRDFQSKAGPGSFTITEAEKAESDERGREWKVVPSPPRLSKGSLIRLSQSRTWILHPPSIVVYGPVGHRNPTMENLLEAALDFQGLKYDVGIMIE